jgi:hypothetical protein
MMVDQGRFLMLPVFLLIQLQFQGVHLQAVVMMLMLLIVMFATSLEGLQVE